MKIQITNQQLSEGVIITDVVLRTVHGSLVELPVKLDKLDFRFVESTVCLVDIGSTALAPTVNNNAAAVEFDPSGKTVRVLDADDNVLMSASTLNQSVLVRVNFSTATVTVFH